MCVCVRSFRTLCGDDTPMVRRAAAGKLGVSLVCVFVRVPCRIVFVFVFFGGGFTLASSPKDFKDYLKIFCKVILENPP